MTVLNTKKNFEKFKEKIIKDLNEIKSGLSFGRGIETAVDHLAAKYGEEYPDGDFKYNLNIGHEDWIGETKSSSRSTINLLTLYGINFYLTANEGRSGDYHSDFNYAFDEVNVFSEKEYKKPKVVYSNSIDENIVEFLDNGHVVIVKSNGERQKYINFKSAMKSISII